jgi:MFS superfamily sulfate permease-like transporter
MQYKKYLIQVSKHEEKLEKQHNKRLTVSPPSTIPNTEMIRSSHYRGDFFGGITTAVVALPLALAFGVSSGAGAGACSRLPAQGLSS